MTTQGDLPAFPFTLQPLSGEILQRLVAALSFAMIDFRQFEFFLATKLSYTLSAVADGEEFGQTVLRVLRIFHVQGRLPELLEKSAEYRSENSDFVTEINSIRAGLPPSAPRPGPGSVYTSLFIEDTPFIGRRALRDELQELHYGNRRVLIINAPDPAMTEECGKSHSRCLIQHIAEENRAHHSVIGIDSNNERPAEYGPEKLVERLVRRMRGDVEHIVSLRTEMEQGHSPDPQARYHEALCKFVFDTAQQSGRLWCFVLHDFNHPDLPPETHEIISGLIKLADTSEPTPVFYRIVLINYLRPVTMQNAGWINKDEITRFERQDIQEAIDFLFRREHIPLNRLLIDSVVRDIINRVPGQDLSRVRDVGDELEATSIKLRDFQG